MLLKVLGILKVMVLGVAFGKLMVHSFHHGPQQVKAPSIAVISYVKTQRETDCEAKHKHLSSAVRNCICKHPEMQPERNSTLVDIKNVNFNYNSGVKFSCYSLSEDLRQRDASNDEYGPHRDILISLFNSWIGDDPWKDATGWNTTINECQWFGVTCEPAPGFWVRGIPRPNIVVELRLPNNNLLTSSGLPLELFEMESLRVLDLSFNDLEIPFIPTDIVNFRNLETLNLASNALQGSLPLDFFPKPLKTIQLSNTWLMTSIPTTISYFRHLEVLDISSSGLVGALPSELGKLRNLKDLRLSDNSLTGSLPDEIFAMTSLENLDLDKNGLMMTRLSSEIGSLVLLEKLNLNQVRGIGSLPTEVGRLTNLKELRLKGPVPEEGTAVEGAFSVAGYSGSLPTKIGLLSNLEVLSLAHNSFMQQVPTELGQLTALKGCDLSFNFFSGSLPDLSTFAKLQLFRFRGTGAETSTVVADDGLLAHHANGLENLVCLDTTGILVSSVPESLCDRDEGGRYITVDCSNTEPCSCCICNGPDYCDVI